ncbi:hypothetical protein OSB04_015217 [Centaurea solstitialis]|uniref:Uncharacterized protein n=1 Tax=Centaurea solstitialis TaxID=347529 RepID=A0AA38TGU4_9ASTR|nr:hypothetical protein OSB04_015217 [Centaurea solstitialis]
MVYTYTPTYYSSLQDSIASICKNILPFSFKKRRLPAIAAAEQRLWKQQSDNLKWQQESFHQILNLMGLFKEGILAEAEVSAFRSHLLDTLVALPFDHEQPVILRDKLIFLQELLYANCISEEEYHTSKTPLLQRLAAQGVKIDPKDVAITGPQQKNPNDEWSVIDLKDSGSKSKPKPQKSAIKQVKGAASVFGLSSSSSSHKNGKDKSVPDIGTTQNLGMSQENPFWNCEMKEKNQENPTVLMSESVVVEDSAKKGKRRPFKGLDGFMKWKKSDDSEKDTVPLSLSDSINEPYSGIGDGPDTKQIKRKLHKDGSSSDFFVDKVLGDKIKNELMKTKAELQLSDDQIEVISTRLPIDKADLKKFFAKKWCDQYGEIVLEVMRKEFKDHVDEIKNMSKSAMKKEQKTSEEKWTTFDDDDENCHPNLFAKPGPVSSGFGSHQKDDHSVRVSKNRNSTDRLFKNNPFFDY